LGGNLELFSPWGQVQKQSKRVENIITTFAIKWKAQGKCQDTIHAKKGNIDKRKTEATDPSWVENGQLVKTKTIVWEGCETSSKTGSPPATVGFRKGNK